MLKSELIDAIYHLPIAGRLFEQAGSWRLINTYNDADFRDSVLKQFQYRNKDFEIVDYDDVSEEVKKNVWFRLIRKACYDSKNAADCVRPNIQKLWDLSYKFCKNSDCQSALKSYLTYHTKSELEKFYNEYLKIYNDTLEIIKTNVPSVLEKDVREHVPYVSKCVLYVDQKDVFEGVIQEFGCNSLGSGWYDEISDRTPEDYGKIIQKRRDRDNAIWEYYQKHPGIRD